MTTDYRWRGLSMTTDYRWRGLRMTTDYRWKGLRMTQCKVLHFLMCVCNLSYYSSVWGLGLMGTWISYTIFRLG